LFCFFKCIPVHREAQLPVSLPVVIKGFESNAWGDYHMDSCSEGGNEQL
jgi:hypothetical protein